MGVLHFVKRVLETKFVHVFSRASMPFKRALINAFHYWYIKYRIIRILFGFNVGIEAFFVRDFSAKTLTPTK